MQRSLDHVTALREIGRHGDFGRIDGLRKQYKRSARSPPSRCHPLPQALALLARHISLAGAFAIPSHRRAHLIKMNLASDPQVRSRSNWGTLLKARRIDPSVADDLAAELEENVAAVAAEAAARALDDEYAREEKQRRRELEDIREVAAREAAASLVREGPGGLGDDGEEVREEPGGLGDRGEEEPDSDAALDAAALELEVAPRRGHESAGRFRRQCTRRPGAWVGF